MMLVMGLFAVGTRGLLPGRPLIAGMAPIDSSAAAMLRCDNGVSMRSWDSIVIQHYGRSSGNPEFVEEPAWHGQVPHRFASHFLIGNGSMSYRDGATSAMRRWKEQETAGPDSWGSAIVISLVGDGNTSTFTEAQLSRLVELVQLLQTTFHVRRAMVHYHGNVSQEQQGSHDLFPQVRIWNQLHP